MKQHFVQDYFDESCIDLSSISWPRISEMSFRVWLFFSYDYVFTVIYRYGVIITVKQKYTYLNFLRARSEHSRNWDELQMYFHVEKFKYENIQWKISKIDYKLWLLNFHTIKMLRMKLLPSLYTQMLPLKNSLKPLFEDLN